MKIKLVNKKKEAKCQRGEVFTPVKLAKEMLRKLPIELFKNKRKTFLDNSCGNGNFLVSVLRRKMMFGISHIDSLKTIYGIELDFDNTEKCKKRLSFGKTDKEIWDILNRNIICANALDPNHEGWSEVGYMWKK